MSESDPMMLRDMASEEKPRERALKYGIGSLSTIELFALLLRVGVKNYSVMQMCRDLLADNGNSLLCLERRTLPELIQTKGFGEAKALQVAAVMEIVRRYSHERLGKKIIVNSPDILYDLMRPDIGNLPHEEIWVIMLKRNNEVISRKCVSKGGSTASIFDLKRILREALLVGAEGLALAHNHPSGNLLPSPQDDKITRSFRDGCRAMDFSCVDHIIVTSGGFYSYRNQSNLI